MRLNRIRINYQGQEFNFALDFENQFSQVDLSPALIADLRAGKHAKTLFKQALEVKDIIWGIKDQRAFLRESPDFLKNLIEKRALLYLGLSQRGIKAPDALTEQREIHYEIRKAQEDLLKPGSGQTKTMSEVIRAFQEECVDKWLGFRFPQHQNIRPNAVLMLRGKVRGTLTWTLGQGTGHRNYPIPELAEILELVQDPLVLRKIKQVLKNLHKELMVCRHLKDHAKYHRVILAEQYHPRFVDKYIHERLELGISSESLKSEIQIIERFWNFAEKNDFIVKNRIRGIKVGDLIGQKNIKTDRSTLTMRDAYTLLKYFDIKATQGEDQVTVNWQEASYVYLVLLLTGCRPSELNAAIIYEPKRCLLQFNPLVKGQQIVGKTASSVRMMKLEPGGTLDNIFRNGLIEGWYDSNVAERFQGFLDRLKKWEASREESFLKNMTGKTLRKTCATWRHALGHDKRIVADEMGHSQQVADSHYVDKFEALRVIGFEQETAKKAWEWFNDCLVLNKETRTYVLKDETPRWFEVSTQDLLDRLEQTAMRKTMITTKAVKKG